VAMLSMNLELPEELVALLGSPEIAAARARESLILELLRESVIGQGKAAQLLGIGRSEILALMAHHRIPSGPETAEEMRQEVEDLHRYLHGS
jgi:predicted HTH domain antitoxin